MSDLIRFTCPHCGWSMKVAISVDATAPRARCGNPGCRLITPLPGGRIS